MPWQLPLRFARCFATLGVVLAVLLFGSVGVQLLRAEPSAPLIDADFPGGNIVVEAIAGDTIRLHQDLRDTQGDWFAARALGRDLSRAIRDYLEMRR